MECWPTVQGKGVGAPRAMLLNAIFIYYRGFLCGAERATAPARQLSRPFPFRIKVFIKGVVFGRERTSVFTGKNTLAAAESPAMDSA
ncbi:hypothetical protein BG58_32280 [Caballeronia jiangsuensis]|nr:hypothetical protein BG58_32280 [Caballeronia jiangsuensis]